MDKRFSTIRRLDVFSNACTTEDSDAHLASRFHSCKLTDEKCQHADIMNSDPDSIGECSCDCICFSQLQQCSCDPSAVTHLLPHPSCYLLHCLLACPCHPTAAPLMLWNLIERALDRNQRILARWRGWRQQWWDAWLHRLPRTVDFKDWGTLFL